MSVYEERHPLRADIAALGARQIAEEEISLGKSKPGVPKAPDSWKVIILTAALTALGTSIASEWLPSLVKSAASWLRREPVLIVAVQADRYPIANVTVAVSRGTGNEVIASGTTDASGIARLAGLRLEPVVVEAVLREGPFERRYVEILKIESLPHTLELDKDKDFSSPIRLATAIQEATTAKPPRLVAPRYGKPLLSQDRQVRALLEIDRFEGMRQLDLHASTRDGILRIEDVLDEVGVTLDVNWNDELPRSLLGPDGKLNNEEMLSIMQRHRGQASPDVWHFYMIVAEEYESIGVYSLLFDTEHRMGGAVFVGERVVREDPRSFVVDVIHEIGHMLNLPHPFQSYGDTRSVMSYPQNWTDWSWEDPNVYKFDEFGRRHILRAPDDYVKPGASAFLDYGATIDWIGFGKY